MSSDTTPSSRVVPPRPDGGSAPRATTAWAAPATHLSPDERVAKGRAARGRAPRSGLRDWEPATDRPDPIALLEEQAATRVDELVPVRYGRMLVSPFTFFRGAALIMASDLAATPRTGFTSSCAAMPTSRTSGCSLLRSAR